ncbi:hypothetical protein [Nonomuraea sp. NPDC050783]|uniref:hypothetical protein n=1 Tax=Nonomuraea sp. NPDC050783 TaxID=3154634 RepID=UPI003466EFE0
MNTFQRLLALSAAASLAATLVAAPAGATAHRPSCPSPSKAEARRSFDARTDRPPRGATAIRGVRVDHLPRGFTYGQVVVNRHGGITEYGYQWSDDRDDVDRRHRSLWVRVVCWPQARRLGQLRNAPFDLGTFSGDPRTVRFGGRTALVQEGDGALGAGLYAGWVERRGVVVTVMAGEPFRSQLGAIIKGIRL